MRMAFKMVPIAVLLLLATAHAQIKIDSTSQKFMIREGETVIMPCQVSERGDFDFALTPVDWTKSQEDYEEQQDSRTNAEGIIMTVGAQLSQKFSASRFKIAYEKLQTGSGGQVQFNLEIRGVTVKDSGTYRCQLHKDRQIVSSVVHHLYVITPIERMWMSGFPDAKLEGSDGQIYEDEGTDGQDKQTPRSLTFFAEKDGYFNCSAEGGYPAPEMWVYVDGERMEGRMQSQTYTDYEPRFVTEQDVGMQSVRVTRTLYSDRMRLDRGKSGSWIQCLAKINEKDEDAQEKDQWKTYSEKSIWARVYVYQEPLFDDKECLAEYTHSRLGQEAQIICRVHGFPFPTVTWENMKTQQKYTGGQQQSRDGSNKEGSSTVRALVLHDGTKFYAKLIFPVLAEEHYADYEIVIANNHGTVRKTIKFMTNPKDDYAGAERMTMGRMTMGLGMTMVLLRATL